MNRRGTCPVCFYRHRLRKDGRLGPHYSRGWWAEPRTPCAGKGGSPLDIIWGKHDRRTWKRRETPDEEDEKVDIGKPEKEQVIEPVREPIPNPPAAPVEPKHEPVEVPADPVPVGV